MSDAEFAQEIHDTISRRLQPFDPKTIASIAPQKWIERLAQAVVDNHHWLISHDSEARSMRLERFFCIDLLNLACACRSSIENIWGQPRTEIDEELSLDKGQPWTRAWAATRTVEIAIRTWLRTWEAFLGRNSIRPNGYEWKDVVKALRVASEEIHATDGPNNFPATDSSPQIIAQDLNRFENAGAILNESGNPSATRNASTGDRTDQTRLSNLNVFRLSGDGFEAQFLGSRHIFKKSLGMEYIHYLLKNSGQAVSPLQIGGGHPVKPRLKGIEFDEADFNVAGSSEPLIDKPGLDRLRRELDSIREDLERAKKDNDLGNEERLTLDRNRLLEQLSKDIGLHGRVRKQPHPAKNAERAVRTAITRAIEKIGECMPVLADHLHESIHKEHGLMYHPSSPLDWEL